MHRRLRRAHHAGAVIPVSEDKDIVVSNVKTAPDAKTGPKGILPWNLTLQPEEQ
jgi:hypothetical protein